MTEASCSALIRACTHCSDEDKKRIKHAFKLTSDAHVGQMRRDGTPYITHPLEVSTILAQWGADADTIITGLLHDTVEDTNLTLQEINEQFGGEVASLVEGVTKFTQADFAGMESMDDEVETLRRLFEVMRKDIRVVIIKIADRLHNLRTIEGLSEDRRISFSRESLDIYYKIAYHLCMNDVCREITNICVPYVFPEKAQIREEHWKKQFAEAQDAAKKIEAELRAVHGNNIQEIQLIKSSHDLPRISEEDEASDRAYYCVIIVKDVDACYGAFKTLHAQYYPVRRKFHDYIASPAESGYRSLHTMVIGPHDKPIQLRIRTPEMDKWVHKGVLLTAFNGKEHIGDMPFSLAWLQRSEHLDRATRESSEAFWKALQSDVFQKPMQVTVNGELISVPINSTALDAAYFALGKDANTIEVVSVNGRESELQTMLNEDDAVSVSLSHRSLVSHNWLQYTTTKFGHNQVVEALKEFDRGEKLAIGQKLMQKELDHFQKILVGEISKSDRERIAKQFNRQSFEEVIEMIGEGVLPASDVVFAIKEPESRKNKEKSFRFRLKLSINDNYRDQITSQISTLAKLHDVNISSIKYKSKIQGGVLTLLLQGIAETPAHYADFLSSLERHSWIRKMTTQMSSLQKASLTSAFFAAFVFLGLDIFLTVYFRDWLIGLNPVVSYFIQILVITPALITNFYFLRMLRHYVVLLRNDHLFLIPIFLLNVLTCFVLVYQFLSLRTYQSIWPILAMFVFFMVYIGYRFIVTERIFEQASIESLRPLSSTEWKNLRRQKVIGYILRLCAVSIWGLQPLYLKYTPADEVNPFVRVFLMGVGVLFVTVGMIAIKYFRGNKKVKVPKLPKNILFVNIVVGSILFQYFLNASLQFTTGTNFILFNSFSPVLALLIGAMLWRSSMPYMREPDKMLWIFLIFLMGSTGSALIIYNSMQGGSATSVYGDVLGICAMAADTLLVVSQIRYMKVFKYVSSLYLNLWVFAAHVLSMLPIILIAYFTVGPDILSVSRIQVLCVVGAGLLAGAGQILNYETFRRIDGFIAFLMFNVSILITFVAEVFFLDGFSPRWALLVGGITIIASTILAEVINSLCQKKGL